MQRQAILQLLSRDKDITSSKKVPNKQTKTQVAYSSFYKNQLNFLACCKFSELNVVCWVDSVEIIIIIIMI